MNPNSAPLLVHPRSCVGSTGPRARTELPAQQAAAGGARQRPTMDTTLRIGPSFSIEAAGRGKLCECPVWTVLWILCLAAPFCRWHLKCQSLLPDPAFEVGLVLFGCVTLLLMITTNIDPGTVPRNVAWLPPDETRLGVTAPPSEAVAPPGMAGRVSVHNGVELRHKFCTSCGVVRPIRAVHCRMTGASLRVSDPFETGRLCELKAIPPALGRSMRGEVGPLLLVSGHHGGQVRPGLHIAAPPRAQQAPPPGPADARFANPGLCSAQAQATPLRCRIGCAKRPPRRGPALRPSPSRRRNHPWYFSFLLVAFVDTLYMGGTGCYALELIAMRDSPKEHPLLFLVRTDPLSCFLLVYALLMSGVLLNLVTYHAHNISVRIRPPPRSLECPQSVLLPPPNPPCSPCAPLPPGCTHPNRLAPGIPDTRSLLKSSKGPTDQRAPPSRLRLAPGSAYLNPNLNGNFEAYPYFNPNCHRTGQPDHI